MDHELPSGVAAVNIKRLFKKSTFDRDVALKTDLFEHVSKVVAAG
jgi:hypothetical protein